MSQDIPEVLGARLDERTAAMLKTLERIEQNAKDDRKATDMEILALGERMSNIENWKSRVVGIALGASLGGGFVGGSIVAAVAKALGT